MRILLAEDDTLLADGLARALGHSGYSIEIAPDGKIADRWLQEEEFDLAILDLGLPGLEGSDVLARLRRRLGTRPRHAGQHTGGQAQGMEGLSGDHAVLPLSV